jgi:hypothetical protein
MIGGDQIPDKDVLSKDSSTSTPPPLLCTRQNGGGQVAENAEVCKMEAGVVALRLSTETT